MVYPSCRLMWRIFAIAVLVCHAARSESGRPNKSLKRLKELRHGNENSEDVSQISPNMLQKPNAAGGDRTGPPPPLVAYKQQSDTVPEEWGAELQRPEPVGRPGMGRDCNITKECHVCPDEALRDEASYCMETGWRQVGTFCPYSDLLGMS